jgi:uncharacterized membrane protein HdeD (DUF308 family)
MQWGVTLIVLGVLSVALVLSAVAVNLVTVWLIVLTGPAQLIIALHTNRVHGLIWRLIVGFAYVLFGAYLIAYPVLGWASLTLVLSRLFLFEGIFDILVFFRLRTIEGSSWVLLKGTVTLLVGTDDLPAVAVNGCVGDRRVSQRESGHERRHASHAFVGSS